MERCIWDHESQMVTEMGCRIAIHIKAENGRFVRGRGREISDFLISLLFGLMKVRCCIETLTKIRYSAT